MAAIGYMTVAKSRRGSRQLSDGRLQSSVQ